MKAISQETLEKINRLTGQTFWNRVSGGTDEQVELLREIGLSGESAAIPEISYLLVDASGPVWHAAAEAVNRLLETLKPLDLVALDQRMREVGSYDREVDRRWRKLRPSDLSRFESSEFAARLLGLASFHSGGYVREAAIKSLMTQESGNELPFLLIRLNDWVTPVREAAAKAVDAKMHAEYAHHFMRCLQLVLRLGKCGRANRGLVENVCGLLRRAECRDILQAGMKSNDRALRRASFQLAADAEQSARAVIIRAALLDADPVARAWAVRRFLPEITAEDLPSVAAPMLVDRFMPVRRDALWALATKCPDFAAEPLRRALLDSHVGMREVARHFLMVAGCFDARRFYLEALEHNKGRTGVAAIRGLGETGRPEDAAAVSENFNSAEPRFRRAATYAVGKLDGKHFIGPLLLMLADESPSVSREALRALLPNAHEPTLEAYWKLFANDKRVFVQRNVLVLMLRFGKWEKLPPLLLACSNEDARLSGFAQNALRAWFRNYNHSFAEPTRIDREKIQVALQSTEKHPPAGHVSGIRGGTDHHPAGQQRCGIPSVSLQSGSWALCDRPVRPRIPALRH